MIRTKKKRGLTASAMVMLGLYSFILVWACVMAFTDTKHVKGGEDRKEVVAVTKSEYQSYKQSQSARGSSGGGRVYVGGGYSYGK